MKINRRHPPALRIFSVTQPAPTSNYRKTVTRLKSSRETSHPFLKFINSTRLSFGALLTNDAEILTLLLNSATLFRLILNFLFHPLNFFKALRRGRYSGGKGRMVDFVVYDEWPVIHAVSALRFWVFRVRKENHWGCKRVDGGGGGGQRNQGCQGPSDRRGGRLIRHGVRAQSPPLDIMCLSRGKRTYIYVHFTNRTHTHARITTGLPCCAVACFCCCRTRVVYDWWLSLAFRPSIKRNASGNSLCPSLVSVLHSHSLCLSLCLSIRCSLCSGFAGLTT